LGELKRKLYREENDSFQIVKNEEEELKMGSQRVKWRDTLIKDTRIRTRREWTRI
jgi:hypothetical protein